MSDLLVIIGNGACWGAVVLVWIGGAIYNAVCGPRARVRGSIGSATLVGAVVASAIVALFGRGFLADHASVAAGWVRFIGLGVLIASTIFTLWARFSLGTMWSVSPRIGGDGQLRTTGPYAVTRHPIYTGLLGMLLGTVLLGGLGQWLVLLAMGLIMFEAKIGMEERLLLANFPGEYQAYRRDVPQLVPGLHGSRRRN